MSNQSETVAPKKSRTARRDVKKKTSSKKEVATEKQTRKQWKQKRKAEKMTSQNQRTRVFPIWLRLIVIAFFAVLALVVGLMIGYGVIGDGNPIDALKVDTWQHIIDIVKKPE